jgi:hypothetical protein
MLYSKESEHGNYYIVNEWGQAIDWNGSLVYHPVQCNKNEYPNYSPMKAKCNHVWIYNIKMGWKVCNKCGERL